MKRLWIGAVFLLAGSTAAQAPKVGIVEVGLRGFYWPEPVPTRVLVRVSNAAAQPQSLRVQVRQRNADPQSRSQKLVHTFSIDLSLQPREERLVEVPVLLFSARKLVLEAELQDSAGKMLGLDSQPLEEPVYDQLIAIVCKEEKTCQGVQSQISFGGTSREQLAKGKAFKFVALQEPPASGWAYRVAQVVVVARPTAELTAGQREALETYVRQGGRLVLLEEESGKDSFLEGYRRGGSKSPWEPVGLGKLFRVRSLGSQQLSGVFSGPILQRIAFAPDIDNEMSWARKRLATRFEFPGLLWLMGWLAAYVVVMGPVNFAILNRWKKREWGWVTVPLVSVLFAAAFYVASSARRPAQFGADEVAIYWMDQRSPVAGMQAGLRVSTPRRATIGIQVPGDAVLTGHEGFGLSRFLLNQERTQGWQVTLGPPLQFDMELLKWSFRDVEFIGTRRLPGTVRRAGSNRLRNETGQSFRDAIFVDKEHVYFLGTVEAGADMDLTAARKEPLAKETGRTLFTGYPKGLAEVPGDERYSTAGDTVDSMTQYREMQELPQKPFAAVELIRGWPKDGGRVFDGRAALFIGIAEDVPLKAQLVGVPTARKNFVVTIVSFGWEP